MKPSPLFLCLLAIFTACAREDASLPEKYETTWIFDLDKTRQHLSSESELKEHPDLVERTLQLTKGKRLELRDSQVLFTMPTNDQPPKLIEFVEDSITIVSPRKFAPLIPKELKDDYVVITYYDDISHELREKRNTNYSGVDQNIKVFSVFSEGGTRYLKEFCLYFIDGTPKSLRQEYIIYRED